MIRQLLYRSGQLHDFTSAEMRGLLRAARAYNADHGITGMLAYCDGLFLQLLEGAPDIVDALYARIAADARHCEVRLLMRGMRAARLLPAWRMAYAEAPIDDNGTLAFEGLAPDTPALALLDGAAPTDGAASTLRRFLTGEPVPTGGLVCAAQWAQA